MAKTAFITGITGQDGGYLAELLIIKGYKVYGLIRRSATESTVNINHLIGEPNFELVYGDLATENNLCTLICRLKPDEVYNLASQSDVGISFKIPEYTGDVTGLGVTRILEAIRCFSPKSKLYQASTSELFGNAPAPQNEDTPMIPASPYACAKLYGHTMVNVYRKSYNIFACCGILFNHESERRGINFVTRKISNAVAKIYLGEQENLVLGNTSAKRDWGYAPDYVRAMYLMLQRDKPDDFVIGTGETHTVQEFVEEAFKVVKLDWRKYLVSNSSEFNRPSDVNYLQADTRKAQEYLNWQPTVTFKELVKIMVENDIKLVEKCR
jgi:GDPmannose 4,6-dehydratase